MNKTLNQLYNPLDIYPESKNYIDKYWLKEEEYVAYWKAIQDRIFDPQAK